MSLDARRASLWNELGLGPEWVVRSRRASIGLADEVDAPPAHEPFEDDVADARALQIARMSFEELPGAVAGCTACALCKTRRQTVFGVGSVSARWMLVGEAPGQEEDARGEPFVGQAGRLLDNMLKAAGLGRHATGADAVYIANVLKCRPPGNRNPTPEEVQQCQPFLHRQIELVAPTLIVVMGRFAAQSLLSTDASIAALRGKAHSYASGTRSVPVIVTYHPAYLLRNLADKSKSWADMVLARATYEAAST